MKETKEPINFGESVDKLKGDLNGIIEDYYKKYLDKYFKSGYMYKIDIKEFFKLQYKLGYENKVNISKRKKIYLYCEIYEELLEVNILSSNRVFVRKFNINSNKLDIYEKKIVSNNL